ncbi:MAG: 50S ribosomal protein L9 [Clostridiales bacterium]|nr:50S ribosomal protein L9 [Clostridiales bacterium]
MKVILLQDVKGTGKKGDLCEVSDGYARNYLLPRKLASQADAAAMNAYQQKESAKVFHKQRELEEAQALASRLQGITVRLSAKGGSAGRLFGAVTTKDIAEAVSRQLAVEVDRRKLVAEDIKSFGTFEVEAKLHAGVTALFYVLVTAEE